MERGGGVKKVGGEANDWIEPKNRLVAIVIAIALATVGFLPAIAIVGVSEQRVDPNDVAAIARNQLFMNICIVGLLILPPVCFYTALVLMGARIFTSFAVAVGASCVVWLFTLISVVGRGW